MYTERIELQPLELFCSIDQSSIGCGEVNSLSNQYIALPSLEKSTPSQVVANSLKIT